MSSAELQEDIDGKISRLEKSIPVIERSDNVPVKKLFWFKLALLYSRRKDENSLNKSSTCLQNCLRLDRRDERVWQSLGEVYFARGSFMSAVKAFQMAIQTRAKKTAEGNGSNDDEYTELRIAECQRILGLVTESLTTYEDVLSRNPDSVPANLGLALTKLSQVDDYFRKELHEQAFPLCRQVIDLAEDVSKLRPDISLSFNLIAYCCLLALLNTENRQIEISASKHNRKPFLSRKQVIDLGLQNLKVAIKLIPDMAPLWHNLAIYQLLVFKSSPSADREVHKQISIKAALKAITLDKRNSSYWNTLGVITACLSEESKQLALHCFLKSMAICKSTLEVPWTSLGILALDTIKKDRKVADHCFANAQAQEPAFTNQWIGQALVTTSQNSAASK